MQVYLNGKELGFGDIDMESISESVSVEQKAIRPKGFECTLSLKIGYGMGYVDEKIIFCIAVLRSQGGATVEEEVQTRIVTDDLAAECLGCHFPLCCQIAVVISVEIQSVHLE